MKFEVTFRKCCARRASDWPAPGSEDTELGVLIELEVGHERRKFTREFKLEAVRLIQGSRRVLCAETS